MEDLTQRHSGDLIVDIMLTALRLEHAHLNAQVTELCSRLGAKIARRLVLHAVSRKNPLSYRLRLLTALGRIEEGFDPNSFFDLSLLSLRDKNPRIRAAAAAALRGMPRPVSREGTEKT